jgi:hypothetical protein
LPRHFGNIAEAVNSKELLLRELHHLRKRIAELEDLVAPVTKNNAVVLSYNDLEDLPGVANPTASVGLTAVNGTATTRMRSDAAPALDVSIAPTWSGNHIWDSGTAQQFLGSLYWQVSANTPATLDGTTPLYVMYLENPAVGLTVRRDATSTNTGEVFRVQTATTDRFTVSQGGKAFIQGECEIDGNLNHDGSNVGFYGVAPTARPSAYTQTYSTATKTQASPSSLATFRPMGELYFFDNGTATTITTASTWTQVQITGTDGHLDSFDTPTVYELRYTGSTSTPFHLGCTVSFSSAGANQAHKFVIVQNATVDANQEYSTGTILSGGTIRTKTGAAGDVVSTAIHIMATLAQNDTLSLFVQNLTSTSDVTVVDMNLFAMGITQDLADDVANVKQVTNAVIDDLQSLGLAQ